MTSTENSVQSTTMILKQLQKAGLVNCEDFVVDNCIFLALTGSVAYGASTDMSDIDIYGLTVPPLPYIYPSQYGEIDGFGKKLPRWDEYQHHNIPFNDSEYDLKIYSLIKFFQLCMQGNPNTIDMLFSPANCIMFITPVMQKVLMKKEIFLSKQCYDRFRGFAYNHLKSMPHIKKGREFFRQFGYDVKDASHVIRQLLGLIEILETDNYVLNRNAEEIIAIRAGKYTLEEMLVYGDKLLYQAEVAKEKSSLRDEPDYEAIKRLLIDSINLFYHKGNFEVVNEY